MRTRLRHRQLLTQAANVTTIKLLGYIFNTLPLIRRRWEFKHAYTGHFFLKVDYTRYDVT
jgi:hypothetical protein